MSFLLQAPSPNVETTSRLPSPQFSDSVGRRLSIDLKRSMNDTKRSYVKSNVRMACNYTFIASRMKALEIEAFVKSYNAVKIRWTDHKQDVWEGYFTINPFEFTMKERSADMPGKELVEFTLSMEGERLANGPRNQC